VARPRQFRTTSLAAQTIYWEEIGTQIAAGQPGYSFVANTAGDSVGAGNPRTLFMVEALGYSSQLWDSAPDSGYSVDNLPPAAPAPFTGAYLLSLTHLSWGRNSEADLAGYRLYRGVTPGFVPSSATLIAEQPDTGYVASPGSWYYKLTAIDIHGNESPASLVSPTGTVAVPSSAPAELAFALQSSNPSRGAASFRLALPRDARVNARLFDAGGRLVRTLADGVMPAGERALAWDGRDESGGDAPPGIYFVRTIADGRAFGVRLVRLR
jgi:flagellar hook capping protein FlgD